MNLQSEATENKVAEILKQAVSECNAIQIAAAEKVTEVRRKAEESV